MTDLRVGADRNLPIVERGTWDGAAAKARVFGLGRTDWRRAFLVYDAAAPELHGSYHLPFADVVGGSLQAVDAGLSAAAGRLRQTQAPASVKLAAHAVIERYQARIKKKG